MASLQEYRKKRHFKETPEPSGKIARQHGKHFVVQEHHARRLHYDFRLEVNGVMKSWAVPKGPSLNPADKRLAIQTEDHPLEYRTFHGTIPAGHYGAGEVAIWDSGTFEPEGNLGAAEQIDRGEIKFTLHGKKLKGSFVLVRIRGRGDGAKKEWLLIKHRDEAADTSGPGGKAAEPMLPVRTRKDKPDGQVRTATKAQPGSLDGARKSSMPEIPQVALATLAENPSSSADWIFEIKWDGIRTIASVKDGAVRLWSRAKREITGEFPDLSEIARHIRAKDVLLDGEIVVLDDTGKSDFQRLQSRMGVRNPSRKLQSEVPVVYYVFDILYCDGYDLQQVPLLERKEFLRKIISTSTELRYSDHQKGEGERLFRLAEKQHLEGIVGKQAASAYPSGRTTAWLKFKIEKEVDAVVGGWTEPRGSREYFGALLLGLYSGGGDRFIFVGGIGSGFSMDMQKRLWPRLQALKMSKCPFAERPATREKATWVRPELVARAKFGGWTEGTHLRQPRFIGLQEDRDPRECTLEKEKREPVDQEELRTNEKPELKKRRTRAQLHLTKKGSAAHAKEAHSDAVEKELFNKSVEEIFVDVDGRRLRLTNLNKVYFPEDGITKRDLLIYYAHMAPLLLPFLKDRPLVLRRYPNGIHSQEFFQKDAAKNTPEWVKTVPIQSEGTGKPVHYFVANDRATLLYLTNLGCIDHNPWSSRAGSLEHPDYIFFDLDPTPHTPFAQVMKLAKILLSILEEAQLEAFSKTSGATGFHIFVPIEARYTFAQARAFVEAVASIVDAKHPELLTAERSLRRRPEGRIYLDAHQNSSGQSLAAVYTVRAFPHAPVSAPVKASEVSADLSPEKWNLRTMASRIDAVGDLWAPFWKRRQEIEPAAERLGHLSR